MWAKGTQVPRGSQCHGQITVLFIEVERALVRSFKWVFIVYPDVGSFRTGSV